MEKIYVVEYTLRDEDGERARQRIFPDKRNLADWYDDIWFDSDILVDSVWCAEVNKIPVDITHIFADNGYFLSF